ESDLLRLAAGEPGLRLAEGKRLVPAALHLAHEENPDADQDQHRQPGQDGDDVSRLLRLGRLDRDAGFSEILDQVAVVRSVGREPLRLAIGAQLLVLARDLAAGDRDSSDLT